jgi:hypothetical protein
VYLLRSPTVLLIISGHVLLRNSNETNMNGEHLKTLVHADNMRSLNNPLLTPAPLCLPTGNKLNQHFIKTLLRNIACLTPFKSPKPSTASPNHINTGRQGD